MVAKFRAVLVIWIGAIFLVQGSIREGTTGKTEFTLSYLYNGTNYSRLLSCNPIGGNHPYPNESCDLINRIEKDFSQFTSDIADEICVNRVPTLAIANGTFRGKQIVMEKVYDSYCHLVLSTKDLFYFFD